VCSPRRVRVEWDWQHPCQLDCPRSQPKANTGCHFSSLLPLLLSHFLSLRHDLSSLSPSWSSFLDLMLKNAEGQPHNRPWFIDLLITGLIKPAFLKQFPHFCEQGFRAVCRTAYSRILFAKHALCRSAEAALCSIRREQIVGLDTDLPFRSCGAQRSLYCGRSCQAARWLSTCAACVREQCSLGIVGTLHCNNDGFPFAFAEPSLH